MGRRGKAESAAAAAADVRVHSWDLYGPTAPGYAPAGEDTGHWEEEPEPDDVTPAEAGEHLSDLLIQLRLSGSLSSKQICCLAHWATLAGACGSCAAFAAKPGLQSGFYQKKVDAFLKVNDDDPLYDLKIPGFDVTLAERCVRTLDCLLYTSPSPRD